jgi:hypothetical protein
MLTSVIMSSIKLAVHDVLFAGPTHHTEGEIVVGSLSAFDTASTQLQTCAGWETKASCGALRQSTSKYMCCDCLILSHNDTEPRRLPKGYCNH